MSTRTVKIGFAGVTSPGNAPSALTVGAVDHKATVSRVTTAWPHTARTARRGTTVWSSPISWRPGHFLASESSPNSSLFKTYPTLRKKGKSGKEFMQLSGTSMSAAVVSGVVALLKQQSAVSLTPNLAKAVLQFTAISMKDDEGG